jgi:cytochrome P450
MSVDIDTVPADGATRKAVNFPLYRTALGFVKDPLRQLERMGEEAGGRLMRVGLGASRPYLATNPDDVEQVLRFQSERFDRSGLYWRPIRDLMTDSILDEGPGWDASKRTLQPVFSLHNTKKLTALMAEAINGAVDGLEEHARGGTPVDMLQEMYLIINETVVKVLFGDKITRAEADVMIPPLQQIVIRIAYRFLFPFMPRAVPMPGDRAFRAAVKAMDDSLFALVERYRDDPGEGNDIFTALCRARKEDGSPVDDRWIRSNLLATFGASNETTTVALTWLWPLLNRHPEVGEKLHEEALRVVGTDRVRAEHLPELQYTKQVVQELLRIFPVGWLFSRVATEDTELGGVPIRKGDTVLVSPFVTQRMKSIWGEDARSFDPDRFEPERARQYHRYAYFPFGGGPHQCVGKHIVQAEAQLILASIFSRFRTRPADGAEMPKPQVGLTLRPDKPIMMTLEPIQRSA